MSVQGIQNHITHQTPQEIRGIQKQVPVSNPVAPDEKLSKLSERPVYDEYIPGEEPEATGLYKVVHDKEGNRKIQFDDPTKKATGDSLPEQTEEPSKETAPSKSEPERKAEKCTTNTDKADREIEKLKDKKEQLEQQIRAMENPKKLEELERQLAQVENELRQKDNDAYRRQNAVIS